MLEPYRPFSNLRVKADIKEIEALGELITQLALPMDIHLVEIFQKLIELAGSREFHPVYSEIYHYVSKLKWARDGIWNTGYIIPWTSLYPSLGTNNHLVSVATNYSQQCHDDDSFRMNYKNPFKRNSFNSFNCFGNGCRPVDINRDEWNRVLVSILNSYRQKDAQLGQTQTTFRVKRFVKNSNSHSSRPEEFFNKYKKLSQELGNDLEGEKEAIVKKSPLKVSKKGEKQGIKRATSYSKSKIISAMMDLEKIEPKQVVSPIGEKHVAIAAGPANFGKDK
jgi:hypothetical protein